MVDPTTMRMIDAENDANQQENPSENEAPLQSDIETGNQEDTFPLDLSLHHLLFNCSDIQTYGDFFTGFCRQFHKPSKSN